MLRRRPEGAALSDEDWGRQHLLFERAFYAVINCSIPIIAAVNGAAFGGGCEFALCCDFIHAAETARFALPEVRLGIMPGGGGTQTLPRAVGLARAKELILSGKPFSAQEALAWGMVNAVHDPAKLTAAVLDLAQVIGANAPVSVRGAKHAMNRGVDLSLESGLAVEIEAYNQTFITQDRREGVTAFAERRSPIFRGR